VWWKTSSGPVKSSARKPGTRASQFISFAGRRAASTRTRGCSRNSAGSRAAAPGPSRVAA